MNQALFICAFYAYTSHIAHISSHTAIITILYEFASEGKIVTKYMIVMQLLLLTTFLMLHRFTAKLMWFNQVSNATQIYCKTYVV